VLGLGVVLLLDSEDRVNETVVVVVVARSIELVLACVSSLVPSVFTVLVVACKVLVISTVVFLRK